MAIELASIRVVNKPWGSADLRPWSEISHDGRMVGEIWFGRADARAPNPALLLKLLFTKKPLSIQVHPDDEFAHSLGLANGKAEAWYVLSATAGAGVAVGLKQQLEAPQLRASIEDGSIADLVRWHEVQKGDVIFVPAGTIHAIGAGLVIAEIQQRSDATFRLFDYGRERELHAENAVAAARAGPAEEQPVSMRLSDARTVLVASPHFVVERIDLAPNSNWELRAEHETWVLMFDGHARVGEIDAVVGEAVFLEADRTAVKVGTEGMKGLMAYLGPEAIPDLLIDLDGRNAAFPTCHFSQPSCHLRITAGAPIRVTDAGS